MKYEYNEEHEGYKIDIRLHRPRIYFRVRKNGKTLYSAMPYEELSMMAMKRRAVAEFETMKEVL